MDVASVATAMLNAAKGAAAGTWPKIQHDFASDLTSVLRKATRIEAQLVAGELTEEEASELLNNDQRKTLTMLSIEVKQDEAIIVENAINAAFDVSLEGPVCGIPFWIIFGLGWGSYLKFREETRNGSLGTASALRKAGQPLLTAQMMPASR